MNWTRFLLISITLLLAAGFIFAIYRWADEFKFQFFFANDYLSLIMVFALVISITGVLKWLLNKEVILTRRGRKK